MMKVNTENMRTSWPIMESFYTIQGEGHYSGRPAYFIRTGGCDVGCVWCDVKESWDAKNHPDTQLDQLLQEVKGSPTEFVVLTGGEPAMYDISALVNGLKVQGKEVAIETSGCYALKGDVDWYCFSPKKFKPPVEEAYIKADELKVVIYHKSDFAWAEGHAAKLKGDCKLYLQPEWSKEAQILPNVIEYVKQNPKWNISLQTHKYMNIP
jgi:organic radical activating enzyme